MSNNNAIILLSGGLDSATVLRLAAIQGYNIYGLSFLYGQRHIQEVEMAKKLASNEKAVKDHKIITLDIDQFGGSSLTDHKMEVPQNRNVTVATGNDIQTENSLDIPNTYVPARNTIFLSYGLAYAEVVNAHHIFIGANVIDYSGYPDCRPEYIESFAKMANLATVIGVKGESIKIHSPLLYLNKKQIIKLGLNIGADYKNTISCYQPFSQDISCGQCDSCLFRLRGFLANNAVDPINYQTKP